MRLIQILVCFFFKLTVPLQFVTQLDRDEEYVVVNSAPRAAPKTVMQVVASYVIPRPKRDSIDLDVASNVERVTDVRYQIALHS